MTCKTVPWFSHARICSLQSWTFMPSSKPAASVEEHIQASEEVEMVIEPNTLKPETENLREDGELPSLNPTKTFVNEVTITPIKVSGIEHSKRLSLISKSMPSPLSKGKSAKSPSFRKYEEELDLMVSDSEMDEPPETDEVTGSGGIKVIDDSWMACGLREYRLILTREVNSGDGLMKLEAKVYLRRYAVFVAMLNM